jgi:uncharacterized protein (TIGR04255 family)
MSDICYSKNFLKEVVSKVDFAQPISEILKDGLPQSIIDRIKERFPLAESSKGQIQNVEFSATGAKTTSSEFAQWVFHGIDRSKTIVINPHFITVSLKKYNSLEDFQEDLIGPISKIVALRNNIQIQRTGVRFVNVFENITEYDDIERYFTPMISCLYRNIYRINDCTRNVTVTEYLNDDMKIRLQSGIFNPDYPAKILRKHFVIDIDAYVDYPHVISNVQEYFTKFHSAIQELFEYCITAEMREYLNE